VRVFISNHKFFTTQAETVGLASEGVSQYEKFWEWDDGVCPLFVEYADDIFCLDMTGNIDAFRP